MGPINYLTFSDAAKFADIARNIINGRGYGSLYNFFDSFTLSWNPSIFLSFFTPPAMPYAIALFFKLFGISDKSVIATSLFFFFLTGFFTYLLGNKLFGKTVGLLVSLVVLINQNFLDYAKTGASEPLFMFEVVAIPYFLLQKKRWATAVGFFLLVISYFTRPQAVIFIPLYILFWMLLKFPVKRVLIYTTGLLLVGLFIDKFVLYPISGRFHTFSVISRAEHVITQHSQYVAVSDVLRGAEKQPASIVLTIKKTGTNLFNFYRSLPNIANPYIFAFFMLSPFVLFKRREERVFVVVTFFSAFLSFILPALTIPFYRYIHPVLPLVYISGVASLVAVLRLIIKKNPLTINNQQLTINDEYKKYLPSAISLIFVLLFVLIMQIGTFIHDYKYYEVRRNYAKPPVYAVLSWKLKEVTKPDDFIITNLDTWGSWYGERKTMWFPLEPNKLKTDGENRIDAIYLTSYLIDDENYYMGPEWRQIFENPLDIEDDFIRENFEFAQEFKIPADEVYEKYDARAVLFTKIQNTESN